MNDFAMLYATFANAEEARDIARALVEARLVACANIQPPHTAIYHWQDEVREDSEVAVWFKTKRDLVVHASERIKAMHSNEIPCVVALPIQGGNAAFLEWIDREAGD